MPAMGMETRQGRASLCEAQYGLAQLDLKQRPSSPRLEEQHMKE